MEIANSIWLIGFISLTAGVLIGVLAYRLLAPSVRQADQVKSDLDATRDELLRYRDDVNQHFDKTAELVNDLTQNYVKVYQHLATGAQNLGDGKRFDNLLEQQPGKVAIAVDDDTITAAASGAAAVVAAGASSVTGDAQAEAPSLADAADAAAAADAADAGVAAAADQVASPDAASDAEIAVGAGAAVEVDDSERADATKRPPESMEPVLNVEALGEAIGKTDRDRDDATGTLADGKPDTEVRTTTH